MPFTICIEASVRSTAQPKCSFDDLVGHLLCIPLSIQAINNLPINYFLIIGLRAIQVEISLARLKFKQPKHFVVVILHTIHITNALTDNKFNFGCVIYEQITPQSVFILISFLCLQLYSKI